MRTLVANGFVDTFARWRVRSDYRHGGSQTVLREWRIGDEDMGGFRARIWKLSDSRLEFRVIENISTLDRVPRQWILKLSRNKPCCRATRLDQD